MRKNNVLSYIIGDHLDSTSIVTDASGNVIAQQKYKAWGEVRYESGTNPSEYSYTGQYSYTDDFGLMFYNARWYDSSLGRFASADAIIPGEFNPSAWDRYAYVNNSPLNYTDPTGHDADLWCANPSSVRCTNYINDQASLGAAMANTAQQSSQNNGGNINSIIVLPNVRVYCGSGSWLACSRKSAQEMDENTQSLYTSANGVANYPLQPLVQLLESYGFNVELFDPLIDPSFGPNPISPLDPNKTYINVGFSSGGPFAMDEALNNSSLIVALVLLEPSSDPGTNLNYAGKLYTAYASRGENNSVQHYFDPANPNLNFNQNVNPHTQLAINNVVAEEIFNFIIAQVIGGQ